MAKINKFERDLSAGLRKSFFAYKIPDAGPAKKPFDFCAAVLDHDGRLLFIAIEAKSKMGYRIPPSMWKEHQRESLDALSQLDCNSAWAAVCFNINSVKTRKGTEGIPKGTFAYIIKWEDYKKIEGVSGGVDLAELWEKYAAYRLTWETIGGGHWRIPDSHPVITR